jgi:uncharacterized MAPEG superfamily protein
MTPFQALLGFAAWTLLLIAGVFLYRGMRFLTGTPINHWPRGNKPADDAPFVKRLEDAHANCLENLPVFAVIVLVAAALGRLGRHPVALAPWVLYARMGQSLGAPVRNRARERVRPREVAGASQLASVRLDAGEAAGLKPAQGRSRPAQPDAKGIARVSP